LLTKRFILSVFVVFFAFLRGMSLKTHVINYSLFS